MELDSKLLDKNLEALRKNQPEIAQWIGETEVDSSVELIKTGSECPNLIVYPQSGKRIVFYDMENPIQKVREEEENHKSYKAYSTFLLGFGLGYQAFIIKDLAKSHHILIVIEQNPYLLKIGFSLNDFSKFFKNETLYVLRPDKDEIRTFIRNKYHKLSQGPITVVADQSSSRVEVDNWFREFLRETLSEFAVNVATVRNISKISIRNQFANVPMLLETPGVKNLFSKFKGIPAIIVSAGPSLSYNIHHLKKFKDKALIISTDTAFRVLLAYDIKPHMVAALCYSELNSRNFSNVCHHEDVPLIYLHQLYAELPRRYQGGLFVCSGDSTVIAWLKDCWEFKGNVNSGTGIAIMCISLAVGMGADPIILVGQDLAETDKSHVEGSISCKLFAERGNVHTDPDRFNWVEGLHGQKVPCPKDLYSQLLLFKRIIKSIDIGVINSTAHGARIEGTEEMPLTEVLETYCKKEYQIKEIINQCYKPEKTHKDRLTTEMETKLRELVRNIKTCQKALKSNRNIFKNIKRKDCEANKERLDKLLKSNFELSTRVQRFAEGFPPLDNYLKDEMFQIHHPDYHLLGENEYEYHEIELGAKKNRMILQATLKGMNELRTEIKRLLSTTREYFKVREEIENNPSNPTGHIRFANWLKEVGRLKKATEYYLKAIKLKEKDAKILYALADTYWMRERYDEARTYLQEVLKLEPGHSGVLDKFSEERQLREEYREKAEQLLDEGDWVNAIICARKVLNISPGETLAQEVLEKAYEIRSQKIEKGNKIMALLSRSTSQQKEYKELMQRAQQKMDESAFPEAIPDLQNALDISEFAEPRYRLGQCYFEMGKMEKAEKEFQYLTTEFPKNPLFHDKLGRVYMAIGNMDLSIEEMYKAAELDGKIFSYLYFEAGKIHMESGNFTEAEKAFRKYLEDNPGSYEAITKIGTCQLAQGDPRKAKENFQEALEIKPECQAAREALKMLEERGM